MRTVPIVTITAKDKSKISKKAGFEQCVVMFVADADLRYWEARAVLGDEEPNRGVGELVESGGRLKEGETGTVIVDYSELTQGDGLYTISIYAQDVFGTWSDGTYEKVTLFGSYNTGWTYNSGVKYNSSYGGY